MSKDCTNRGGTRVGAGRKPKPLADKIKEGIPASAMPEPQELVGVEMPEIRSYLSDEQRMGELKGKEIFEETYRWIARHRCEHIVGTPLIEQYAITMARAIQLEQITSEYGFISKHPTTGAAISSPFVSMAQNYLKQANIIWQQIFAIVQENSREPVTGNPQDDLMERLLGS